MPSPSVAILRTQSDERLAALAATGHERAFEAIVERYRRPLLRHCRRFLPEARAEDALQQALVSAWSALRRGDDVQALRPWLYRIVHNTALNALRAAGYDYEELHELLVPSDPRGGPAELAEHRAVVQRTLAGLAALPERQREALLQIAVEGRSQDEVAQGLGLSQGAVRQLVHRARTSLRTAATVAVPLPLATWLATAGAGRADLVARVGELVAGAGAGAAIAKAGTVAVLAGGALGGPAIVDELKSRPPKAERAVGANTREGARAPAAPVAATTPGATPAAAGGGAPQAPDKRTSPRRADDHGGRSGPGDGGEEHDVDDRDRDAGGRGERRRGGDVDANSGHEGGRKHGGDGSRGDRGGRRGDDGSPGSSGRGGDDTSGSSGHGDDASGASGHGDDDTSGSSGPGGGGARDEHQGEDVPKAASGTGDDEPDPETDASGHGGGDDPPGPDHDFED